MSRAISGMLVVVLAAAVGCSGNREPEQPKLTDEQIKALMKQGAERREGADPRPGGGPRAPAKGQPPRY